MPCAGLAEVNHSPGPGSWGSAGTRQVSDRGSGPGNKAGAGSQGWLWVRGGAAGLQDQVTCLPICPRPFDLMLRVVTLDKTCVYQVDKMAEILGLFLDSWGFFRHSLRDLFLHTLFLNISKIFSSYFFQRPLCFWNIYSKFEILYINFMQLTILSIFISSLHAYICVFGCRAREWKILRSYMNLLK